MSVCGESWILSNSVLMYANKECDRNYIMVSTLEKSRIFMINIKINGALK